MGNSLRNFERWKQSRAGKSPTSPKRVLEPSLLSFVLVDHRPGSKGLPKSAALAKNTPTTAERESSSRRKSRASMTELQVLNGPLQWQTIKVDGPRFVIGRRDGCHLVLKDGWISREHSVIIEVGAGEFIVQDLGSENGIFVNGIRVTESPLRHSDILRVGRTEMRFFSVKSEGSSPSEQAEYSLRRDSTVQDSSPQTISAMPMVPPLATPTPAFRSSEASQDGTNMEMTVHESGVARTGRIDLRDRVRRLERILQQKEEDNARLAAENAVFKRAMATAGLIDRSTGLVDMGRLATPAPREAISPLWLPWIWNPFAIISFPKIGGGALPTTELTDREPDSARGAFRLAVIGAGAVGAKLSDAFYKTGYRQVAAFSSDAESLAELSLPAGQKLAILSADQSAPQDLSDGRRCFSDSSFRLGAMFKNSIDSQRERVLIAFGLGGATDVGVLAPLVEILSEAGIKPAEHAGIVVLPKPGSNLGEGERKRTSEGLSLLRTLSDAGRFKPLLVVEERCLDRLPRGQDDDPELLGHLTVAGVFDLFHRAPLLPSVSGGIDVEILGQLWNQPGLATIGLAGATKAEAAGDLGPMVRHALTEGLLCGKIPASRARSAVLVVVIGSEVLAQGGASVLTRLESAVEAAKGTLPQAKLSTAVYQATGTNIRVAAWIGGLPFPEALVDEVVLR